jgi:PAS domain-containing protein
MAAEVAQTHHERWDGRGYPAGLSGGAIPITGRIVAVADYFDALTMDRVYRPAFRVEEALAMLAGERGRSFDPQVVDMFIAHAPALVALRDRINQHGGEVETLAGAALLNVRKFLAEFGTLPEAMVAAARWEGGRPMNALLFGVPALAALLSLGVLGIGLYGLRRSRARCQRLHGELERAQAEVRTRERELHVLLRSVQELIFRTDAEGRVIYLNDRWLTVVGEPARRALGRPC